MQIYKKILIFLTLVLLVAGCGSQTKDQKLLMTCDVNVSAEDETKMQDYYGSDDKLERFVQKTEIRTDNKQELEALKENKLSIEEEYEDITGVYYSYDVKDDVVIEKLEIIIEEVELSTLIDLGILDEGVTSKEISISKTKEALEANKIAKCKLID